ncbi:MAG TPA: SIMPL domain-containing protein [Phnomibacter sp.]|nr:SIMPL domain-containing protein [Phnomibacter sp.]
MKHLLTILIALSFLAPSFAQTVDRSSGTIDVLGNARVLTNPPNYTAQILIEEEEQKAGYTTIGKLSIDTIKISLMANLKKFGIEEKEAKLLVASSRPLGQYPNQLLNRIYEVKLKDKDQANKLLTELRFAGLNGMVIKRELTPAQKLALADSLYNSAIDDARRIATELAKKENKTVGEIKTIELRYNSLSNVNTYNEDNFNSYGYSKFEMDYRDKYANCTVRVVFEMK